MVGSLEQLKHVAKKKTPKRTLPALYLKAHVTSSRAARCLEWRLAREASS